MHFCTGQKHKQAEESWIKREQLRHCTQCCLPSASYSLCFQLTVGLFVVLHHKVIKVDRLVIYFTPMDKIAHINSAVYPGSCNLLMLLLSFELEVISNKSSSLVGEICELHIVLSHQRTFFYELLNFGKGAGNKSVVN